MIRGRTRIQVNYSPIHEFLKEKFNEFQINKPITKIHQKVQHVIYNMSIKQYIKQNYLQAQNMNNLKPYKNTNPNKTLIKSIN